MITAEEKAKEIACKLTGLPTGFLEKYGSAKVVNISHEELSAIIREARNEMAEEIANKCESLIGNYVWRDDKHRQQFIQRGTAEGLAVAIRDMKEE